MSLSARLAAGFIYMHSAPGSTSYMRLRLMQIEMDLIARGELPAAAEKIALRQYKATAPAVQRRER